MNNSQTYVVTCITCKHPPFLIPLNQTQKQQQESISASEGSNLRETG